MAPVVDGTPNYVDLKVFQDEPSTRVDIAKIAPFGYVPALILALVGFIDKAEIAITGGALEKLKEEFGFNDAIGSLLFTAPILASVLLIIPAGILADTRRRKNILLVVVVLWSVFSFGSAAAPSLIVLFIFRMMLGAAAPLNVPPTASLIGDLYPRRSRTKAFGLVRALENIGLPVGTLIGAVVGGLVGWRAAFLVVGIPGLILAVVLYRFLQEPVRGVGDKLSALADDPTAASALGVAPSDAPAAPLAAGPKVSLAARAKEVFAIPTVRRLLLGQAILFASFAGVFAFAVSFFARFYFDDLSTPDEIETATAGFVVSGLSIPAIAGGAYLASFIDAKYGARNPILRIVVSMWAIAVGIASLVLYVISEPLGIRIVFFVIFAGVNIIAVANLAAAVADVIPARARGSGFAIVQMALAIGSAFGPAIIGIVSAATGDDLRWGFFALSFPLLLGLWIVGRSRATYVADADAVTREAAGSNAAAD